MQHIVQTHKPLLTIRHFFMIIGILLFIFVGLALMSRTATPAMAHNIRDPQPEAQAISLISVR